MFDWRNYELEEVTTEDGSPTLRDLQSPNLETMHHRGGAATETLYIYGEALQIGLQNQLRQVWSVGLGCGYNELLVADLHLKNPAWDPQLLSFETRAILVEQFEKALIASPREEFYDRVGSSLRVGDLAFKTLFQMKKGGSWRIQGDFLQFPRTQSCEILLFDAFSAKTDERLWTPAFLGELFAAGMNSKSLVVTYACTGHLKRALKGAGYELIAKPGFKGRRDSTLAVRGFSL